MVSIALRILNMNEMSTIEEENNQIKDAQERDKRSQLLEAIWEKITDYDIHVLEYEYKQHVRKLIERGIEFIMVDKQAVEASWEECFGSSVSEEEKKKKKHYNEQFRWHLFSFELLDALKEDHANTAFDATAKDTVYLFFQESEEAYLIKNASLLKAEDFDIYCDMTKADLYVFDPEAKWTYVKTHEATCGPYFYCAKDK